MEQAEVFLVFTDRLEETGINYMATGSVASMLYGIPRFWDGQTANRIVDALTDP